MLDEALFPLRQTGHGGALVVSGLRGVHLLLLRRHHERVPARVPEMRSEAVLRDRTCFDYVGRGVWWFAGFLRAQLQFLMSKTHTSP